jgi:TPR repeat protein
MNARLSALIADYQSRVSEAVDLLERGLGITRPASNREWTEYDIPQNGSLPGPAAYFKHGYGCAIFWPDAFVDFDFGTRGEIDGFDAMRLAVFMETNQLAYGLSSHDEIRELLEAATEAGEIVCAMGYGLAYLALDAETTQQAAQVATRAARVKPSTMREEGRRVPPSVGAVASWYRMAAEQGLPEAQYILGTYCRQSENIQEARVEAPKWFRRAAEQGHALAQYEMGMESADEEAMKWLRSAAEQGHALAQYEMGIWSDDEEAMKWYRRAADQGLVDAQCELGICYYDGFGVRPDIAEAVKWLRPAAEQGLALAQLVLGHAYSTGGEGVPQNYALAAAWLRKAAKQGDEAAQDDLAELLASGLADPQEPGELKRWSHAPDAGWQWCPHCKQDVQPSLDGRCSTCETQIAPPDTRTAEQLDQAAKRMRSDVPCLFVACAGLTLLVAAVVAIVLVTL